MTASLIGKADRWITAILSYPGIDKDFLVQKKINWLASVAVTSMVLVVTLSYHFIFPQLRILIWYGLFLTVVFSQGLIYPIIFRQTSRWLLFIDQTLVALATFVAILLLGGIPWSGGLVMVGFALIFFSLNFRRKSHSIAIYVIYIVTVLIAGILQPWLAVPPEMTTEVNISLFVVNTLWISGFAMAFARAIGEYGSVIFIAGNMPMISEIAPLMIITKLEQYDYAGATAVAVVMLIFSFILLLIINVILLITGCFLDTVPAIIVMAPMLLPTITHFGISPVHFGVIMAVNLAFGLCTPPYGCNLFVGAAVAKIQMESMFKYIIPFFLVSLVVLTIITYVPWLSMVFVQ